MTTPEREATMDPNAIVSPEQFKRAAIAALGNSPIVGPAHHQGGGGVAPSLDGRQMQDEDTDPRWWWPWQLGDGEDQGDYGDDDGKYIIVTDRGENEIHDTRYETYDEARAVCDAHNARLEPPYVPPTLADRARAARKAQVDAAVAENVRADRARRQAREKDLHRLLAKFVGHGEDVTVQFTDAGEPWAEYDGLAFRVYDSRGPGGYHEATLFVGRDCTNKCGELVWVKVDNYQPLESLGAALEETDHKHDECEPAPVVEAPEGTLYLHFVAQLACAYVVTDRAENDTDPHDGEITYGLRTVQLTEAQTLAHAAYLANPKAKAADAFVSLVDGEAVWAPLVADATKQQFPER